MVNLQASGIRRFAHLAAFDSIVDWWPNQVDLTPLFVYIIDTVPADALPVLAEQFDVLGYKGWRFADTEQKKRDLIKKAIELHRFKGTPWSIREALKIIGFDNTVVKENLPGNTYNGQWNHNGNIYYNSPHWAHFRVVIDATTYGILTPQQIADVIELIIEYKNARSHLLDVSFGYYFNDEVNFDDSGLELNLPTAFEEDLSGLTYNGAALYNGVNTYNSENDILTVNVIPA